MAEILLLVALLALMSDWLLEWRPDITWHLPGSMRGVYSGEEKPRWRWLCCTAIGGYGLWSIWIRCGIWLLTMGHIPSPRDVTTLSIYVIQRALQRPEIDA